MVLAFSEDKEHGHLFLADWIDDRHPGFEPFAELLRATGGEQKPKDLRLYDSPEFYCSPLGDDVFIWMTVHTTAVGFGVYAYPPDDGRKVNLMYYYQFADPASWFTRPVETPDAVRAAAAGLAAHPMSPPEDEVPSDKST